MLPLWDAYFQDGDPFFIFFLALVMLVNAREFIFSLSAESSEHITVTLATMPRELTAEDIRDMCELAQHYHSMTPQTFRAENVRRLFACGPSTARAHSRASSVSSVPGEDDLFHALCMELPAAAVLRRNEGLIKYFIVDCRPLAHFDAGHLPQSWHLDARLMMEHPKLFAQEVERMQHALNASLQHPVFLGISDDDDRLGMLVSHFLQRKQKYVSMLTCGFRAVHEYLDADGRLQTVLDNHQVRHNGGKPAPVAQWLVYAGVRRNWSHVG